MSEGALTEETMLAALQDIRLPADAPGGLAAEIAVGLGLGGLAAMLLLGLLGLLVQRRGVAPPLRLPQRLAALSSLPEAERRVALLHLLKSSAPEAHARLRSRLYAPGNLDLTEIEAEVRRRA